MADDRAREADDTRKDAEQRTKEALDARNETHRSSRRNRLGLNLSRVALAEGEWTLGNGEQAEFILDTIPWDLLTGNGITSSGSVSNTRSAYFRPYGRSNCAGHEPGRGAHRLGRLQGFHSHLGRRMLIASSLLS